MGLKVPTIKQIQKKDRQYALQELDEINKENAKYPFRYPPYLGIVKEMYYHLTKKERPSIT